ncbi:alpha/beta hydrolase [Sphingobium sp. 3R8]|nr:alpha/beta hydrolase [Sphingobium sp. 3R8]
MIADVGGADGAPLVVLLHGGGQTRHSWSNAQKSLIGEGYRVINFDARGHGESDWSQNGDYGLPVRSHDLATVIGDYHGPIALVGASMGGMTSFYAVGHGIVPGVQALIMVDIVIHPAAIGVQNIRHFMAAHADGFSSVDEAADAVAAYNPQRTRPRDTRGLMRNLRKRPNGRLHWHWDPRMLDADSIPENHTWTDELVAVSDRVCLPTLVIRGEQSDIVDDAGVAEMRALVPQTEIFTIPDAGHMVAGDKNDVFNSGVIDFLRRSVAAL